MAVALPRGEREGKGGKPIHPLLRPFPPVCPSYALAQRQKKNFPFSPLSYPSYMHVISVPFFRTPFSSQTFFLEYHCTYGLQVLCFPKY